MFSSCNRSRSSRASSCSRARSASAAALSCSSLALRSSSSLICLHSLSSIEMGSSSRYLSLCFDIFSSRFSFSTAFSRSSFLLFRSSATSSGSGGAHSTLPRLGKRMPSAGGSSQFTGPAHTFWSSSEVEDGAICSSRERITSRMYARPAPGSDSSRILAFARICSRVCPSFHGVYSVGARYDSDDDDELAVVLDMAERLGG
mmetsp:Transcript_89893/g.257037  ORF Transcript_89893/g.257037 Transcript_89893/m.257037 type:complete len:202 (-) Transcript_89893:258-863(-)